MLDWKRPLEWNITDAPGRPGRAGSLCENTEAIKISPESKIPKRCAPQRNGGLCSFRHSR